MKVADPRNGGGFHLLHHRAAGDDALTIGVGLVEAVARGDDPEAAAERGGVVSQVGRGEVALPQRIESGK